MHIPQVLYATSAVFFSLLFFPGFSYFPSPVDSLYAQILSLPDASQSAPRVTQINHLKTQWAKDVRADNVHNEYPRPGFLRKDWFNLNGVWQFTAIAGKMMEKPVPILVPFPPGSPLSGVARSCEQCIYRRQFVIPKNWNPESRILLHFGAVDWDATISINRKIVGTHKGGYTPFSFDITGQIKRDAENELTVEVFDPTNRGQQPRGKQTETPGGIWYSAVTGIWQTVWLEPVPADHIERINILPDYDTASIKIQSNISTDKRNLVLYAEVLDSDKAVAKCYGGTDGDLLLQLEKIAMKSWSPETPHLYQVVVKLLNNDEPVDQIRSYFAFRKIEKVREKNGHCRIWLNGKPLFQLGVIDQGYWSDGFYTAPTDGAVRMDIHIAKMYGFNVIRKYQKIEPERFYFWCDRLGILVWQDMPAGENKTEQAQMQFQNELTQTIESLSNHPSIVLWTIFNEGAGQHQTAKYFNLVRQLDPTRLINVTSGWTDSKLGDVNVSHKFPGPEMPVADANRASVIGVYGGLTLVPPIENLWTPETWGYQNVSTTDELLSRYREMQFALRKMIISDTLAGAFFHQLTDVESECNGLTSYDRVRMKVPTAEEIEKLNQETIRQGSRQQ
ncbi:beta-galactosidase [Planctomycetales bacterium]|nr:beta-galactosidase [Planctomycetales bacterium]